MSGSFPTAEFSTACPGVLLGETIVITIAGT